MVDKELLEILACPACDARPPVELKEDKLVCTECGRRYPIRDGIPVMLVDEAEQPQGAAGPATSSPRPRRDES